MNTIGSLKAKKDKNNQYRDYYIWHDPVNGHEPNTWHSSFSGSAWQFDEHSGQYYLHLFSTKQPDLNWDNKNVRRNIFSMMRKWLDRGIDGFRMDVINDISKPADLTDSHSSPANGPHVHEYLQEMNQAVLQDYDIMTVGEMGGTTPQDALQYAGFKTHELNMIFQFQHMDVDADPELGKWRPKSLDIRELKRIMSQWQIELDGKAWNSLYWNNHDQPRIVSRFGNDTSKYWALSAKMLGAVLHYQQGTPYIYQGEEIGMTNVKNFTDISDYRDIETLNAFHDLVEARHILTTTDMMNAIQRSSRDNARTPMQWDATANAGFTSANVTPWIKVNSNYTEINAIAQVSDPNSIFSFYKKMNLLRRQYPIITYGNYSLLNPDDDESWIYQRRLDDQVLTVMANFTSKTLSRSNPDLGARIIQSNYTDEVVNSLRPYEVKVFLSGDI